MTPPPSSVPVFIVTLSRMSQSAPTTSRVGAAAVLHRLRRRAERGERINHGARADRGVAGDMHVRDQPAAVADHDVRTDRRNTARSTRRRPIAAPGGDARRSDRSWRIVSAHAIMAPTSASATIWPRDLGLAAEPPHVLAPLAILFM